MSTIQERERDQNPLTICSFPQLQRSERWERGLNPTQLKTCTPYAHGKKRPLSKWFGPDFSFILYHHPFLCPSVHNSCQFGVKWASWSSSFDLSTATAKERDGRWKKVKRKRKRKRKQSYKAHEDPHAWTMDQMILGDEESFSKMWGGGKPNLLFQVGIVLHKP